MKKERELTPTIEKHENISISNLEELKKNLSMGNDIIKIEKTTNNDSSDNFFRAVINEMLNDHNIDLKTEYVSLNEVFASAKLQFLAKYGRMSYLADFDNILARKRVSYQRKSRIELIKAFDKRDEEINAVNRLESLRQLIGGQ